MRGVVFTGERELEFLEVPDPTPGPGEVVVEIKASGMCGSDLHQYRRPKSGGSDGGIPRAAHPVIAGHEPAGIVAAVGAGVDARLAAIGRRVMVHHYAGCTVCDQCRSGWSQLCERGPVAIYGSNAHGGHAPWLKVPAFTLVPLPEALSFAAGAAISCGTGTAFGALRRMGLSGHHTIAIFGQGPVGLSATQLAAAMGARVIAVDVVPERLARAQGFGATAAIDARADDPVAAIAALTEGRGADLTLDSSGAAEGRANAVRAARLWGTVCFVGERGTVTLDVSRDMLRKQLTLIGSWTFSSVGQAACARFIAERGIAVDRLFTHRWPLAEAEAAYRQFDRQTMGKGVFEM